MNLPGSKYHPIQSWMRKIHSEGKMASNLFPFMDDEQINSPTELDTWHTGHALGSKQLFLDIQDIARKVGPYTLQPRVWAGAVFHVVEGKILCKFALEEEAVAGHINQAKMFMVTGKSLTESTFYNDKGSFSSKHLH